ncbi:MAG: hypothetical protein WCF18_07375 [Chthoniobacteraceae bacterium]
MGWKRYTPILADAGSPLAWDQSGRVLWFIDYGSLSVAFWTGKTFLQRDVGLVRTKTDGGILVDPGLHFVFCLDADGEPQWVHRIGAKWIATTMGGGPIARLLGVDALRHRLFAYDAEAQGIRLYLYDAATKSWTSSIIADGLGAAGDAGAFDVTAQVLYTSHADVAPTVARHPSAQAIGDPTGFDALDPWPLVATSWDGTAWTSRVLDETGVPQQPAVRATDHRVFFAKREDTRLVHYYQPATATAPDAFGQNDGWSGQDTWEDNDSYKILAPTYPSGWLGSFEMSGSVTISAGFFPINSLTGYDVTLTGPITVVPYYAPVWSDVALADRLTSFRAVINPKQSRLVQHREIFSGEIARQQTGLKVAGYLYRDANGVFATEIASATAVIYPPLGATFDPANPPTSHARLAAADGFFYARPASVVIHPALPGLARSNFKLADFTLAADTALLPPQLRGPTAVHLRTFGHRYASTELDQPGGRYRNYSHYGTGYAVASGVAVDGASGLTFYTQAPPPDPNSDTEVVPSNVIFGGTILTVAGASPPVSPQFTGPHAQPDVKHPRPSPPQVWIVVAY